MNISSTQAQLLNKTVIVKQLIRIFALSLLSIQASTAETKIETKAMLDKLSSNQAVSTLNNSKSSSINEKSNLAEPCESVEAESKLLKELHRKIKHSSKQLKNTNSQKVLDQFWENVEKHGTPYIEPIDDQYSRMVYLWRGAKNNVRLIGGPSNDHEWLTRLAQTDVWFKEKIVDNRFIGSYSFAVDLPNIDGYLSNYCPHLNPKLKESRSQRRAVLQVQKIDPFNPKRFLNDLTQTKFRNENIISLKNAPTFVDPQQLTQHPSPKLSAYWLKSNHMNNQRLIQIYKSKKKNPKDQYVTAIFFDGQQYSELLDVPKALDILVEQNKLAPIQAVFVSHPSDSLRPQELTPNEAYTSFFIEELLPSIDQHLENRNNQKTVLLGSSLGGLSSAYLALKFPQQISHIVPLSGSFWWKKDSTDLPNGMSKIIRENKTQAKQHWYITANSYESSRANNQLSILDTSAIVAQDLKNQGHEVHYQNYIGGHSYAIWQVILQDALLSFFGTDNSGFN